MKTLTSKESTLLIILSALLEGCITISSISAVSGMEKNELKKIPLETKTIYVERQDTSSTALFEEVVTILIDRGHRVIREDKERLYILTEGKDVGASTFQRMTLIIKRKDHTSLLKISTEWKAGAVITNTTTGLTVMSDWAVAKWETTRIGIAFAESASVAHEIKGGKVIYE